MSEKLSFYDNKPNRPPHRKLPWKALLPIALIVAIGFTLTHKAGSSANRLRQLEKAHKRYASPYQKAARKAARRRLEECTAEFTIKSADGSPLSQPFNIYFSPANSLKTNPRVRADEIVDGLGTNEIRVQKKIKHTGWISSFDIRMDGFAVFSGTGAAADADGKLRLPEVVLQPAYEARVRFVDPDGNPIPHMDITSLFIKGMGSGSAKPLQADAAGEFKIPQCGPYPIRMSIFPPDGFSAEERTLELKDGETFDWVLKRAPIFSGRVVDEQGQPIAGARIYLFRFWTSSFTEQLPAHRIVATTDKDGAFTFQRMLAGDENALGIVADGYWGQTYSDSTVEDGGKTYTLREGGDVLIELHNVDPTSPENVLLSYFFERDHGKTVAGSRKRCQLISSSETEAVYKLHCLWEGDYIFGYGDNFDSGDNGIEHRFNSDDVEPVITLDIAKLTEQRADDQFAKHRIELTVVPPANEPMPFGTIELHYQQNKRGGRHTQVVIPQDGKIVTEMDMPLNAKLAVSPGELSGYSFDEMEIDSATTNFTVTCKLEPAGGGVLTCKNSAGKELPRCSWVVYEEQAGSDYDKFYDAGTGNLIEPLPLGRKFRIETWTHDKETLKSIQFESDWFTLSKYLPIKKISGLLEPKN